MEQNPKGNGWEEWRNHILSEQCRFNKQQEQIFHKLNHLEVSVGQLKIKSGIWGMLGGLIPVVIALIIILIKFSMGIKT